VKFIQGIKILREFFKENKQMKKTLHAFAANGIISPRKCEREYQKGLEELQKKTIRKIRAEKKKV